MAVFALWLRHCGTAGRDIHISVVECLAAAQRVVGIDLADRIVDFSDSPWLAPCKSVSYLRGTGGRCGDLDLLPPIQTPYKGAGQ